MKTWEPTRTQGLYRHANGRYYARLYAGGSEAWKSLKTASFSVAEARLGEIQKAHKARRATTRAASTGSAELTVAQAAEVHFQKLAENVALKRSTRSYWAQTWRWLSQNWPSLPSRPARRVTPADCREWAARAKDEACSTRYNNALGLLRSIFAEAIAAGAMHANPAADLQRVKLKQKRLELPTRANFAEMLAEMRAGHSRDSKACADLAEGLATTGARLGEARWLLWRDVDFAAGEITFHGDPVEGTKGGESRRVPMIASARALLERLNSARESKRQDAGVFAVHECQKSIDRACLLVGMARITHHDLRHLFATICIESGVDIPTVSRWLGHKDGGALAMRTYGHLRREHSQAQAAKVAF